MPVHGTTVTKQVHTTGATFTPAAGTGMVHHTTAMPATTVTSHIPAPAPAPTMAMPATSKLFSEQAPLLITLTIAFTTHGVPGQAGATFPGSVSVTGTHGKFGIYNFSCLEKETTKIFDSY